MKKGNIYIGSVLLILISFSCTQDDLEIEDQEIEPTPLLVSIPDYFPPYVDSEINPITEEGVKLGEKLFFDKRLSGNNEVACATCHLPELAFSDGVALASHGISGKKLLRNAPALINLAWANNGLFWDGGSKNLESQVLAPLAHEDEMFQDLSLLIEELNQDEEYLDLFSLVFNDDINQTNIMWAIAQFERSLISSNSKYDAYLKGEKELTEKEYEGLALAENLCFSCHDTALLTDHNYHNNGIDEDFSDTSHEGIYQGRYRVTFDENDLGKFKTPTLRNVALTAPYMHDGRFETLEEVINHYSDGVKNSSTLDVQLKPNNTLGFSLSISEKENLLAFLKTLTDSEFVK